MEFLSLAIVIVLLLPLCRWLVPFAKKSRKNTLVFSGILSALLLPVTFFILNQHGLILAQQTEVIEWVAGNHRPAGAEEEKYQWIKEHFIFIDNSYSNQLVSKPGSNQLGNSTFSITNRKELTRLFQTIYQGDTLTDLIVVDIFMDIITNADSALLKVMTKENIESKLILAHNFLNPNAKRFASLNDSVFGNIVESGYEHSFASFKPYRDGRPSLAYLLYRKVQELHTNTTLKGLLVSEKKENHWRAFGLNCYIPHFELTEEEKIYADEAVYGDERALASGKNYFEMGDLVNSPAQQQSLLQTLQQRKADGMKNIVFIGSFKGTSEDIYSTYYGRLHGATILLNLFYSLRNHQHRLSVWFIIYLWVSISCIIFIAVRKATGMPLFSDVSVTARHSSVKKTNKFLQFIRKSASAIWEILILDELHFWLFVVFIFATAILWGRIINGVALFLLLHIVYKVFHYYSHVQVKEHSEAGH